VSRSHYRREPAQNLWVVVPAYNEAALIAACLDSLLDQRDRDFSIVVVDNNSTDNTADVVKQWARAQPSSVVHLVREVRKGTGAASDTGFRFAIDRGADWIARTDADCIVAADWIARIRSHTSSTDMLGGKIRPRTDDVRLHWLERAYLPAVTAAARLFGVLRPSNRGPQYKTGYVMCVGNNLAIAADTYLASGGFPRFAIEELPIPNDRALVNRVRVVSSHLTYAPDVVVYNSIRRLRAYGLRATLRWYASHTRRSDHEVDVR